MECFLGCLGQLSPTHWRQSVMNHAHWGLSLHFPSLGSLALSSPTYIRTIIQTPHPKLLCIVYNKGARVGSGEGGETLLKPPPPSIVKRKGGVVPRPRHDIQQPRLWDARVEC